MPGFVHYRYRRLPVSVGEENFAQWMPNAVHMNTGSSAPLITVCIPTHNRPEELELAIRSVLIQAYEPTEIVIGDDSSDDRAERVVQRLSLETGKIRYRRNFPKLGQNANVNALFSLARGDFLILLHDDDYLAPDSLSILVSTAVSNPRVRLVFGKQIVISATGESLLARTDELNAAYGRNRSSGPIEEPIVAALRQQIPNDGYLISADVARRVGYRSDEEIGVFGDIDFGIRVAMQLERNSVWFVDTFTAYYRLSRDSISTSSRSRRHDHPFAAAALYRFVTSLVIPEFGERARSELIRASAPSMIRGFAKIRDRKTALQIFASPEYGWSRRLSFAGAYHLTLIAFPALDTWRRY